MNKELIISETEQFINDEIFYIQIEYDYFLLGTL